MTKEMTKLEEAFLRQCAPSRYEELEAWFSCARYILGEARKQKMCISLPAPCSGQYRFEGISMEALARICGEQKEEE